MEHIYRESDYMTSFYFEDLSERYNSELDDLRTDSENRNVLAKRWPRLSGQGIRFDKWSLAG
ncbi:Uncharacterized protein pbN1_37650 [Aromatoleum bremense]|nr:Uncharacterized protein pbN1_37650 [Aromatoleum bremense]